uniref:Uncharacterized protein n=1 Tax=Rhizophora mucronata TaxID=61149 RepID=A0A2P2IM44_RHIMU
MCNHMTSLETIRHTNKDDQERSSLTYVNFYLLT